MAHFITRSLVCSCVAVLTGCFSTTSLSTTWRDQTVEQLDFKKVAVLVVNSSPAERRAQEEKLASHITRIQAVPSHTFISDDVLKDVVAAKAKIIADGFDGAVLLRMVDTREETTQVPGRTTVWNDPWGHVSYEHSASYVTTDVFYRAEVTVHTVPEGRLIWAGASETMNPRNAASFADEVAKATAAELRKQKLIR